MGTATGMGGGPQRGAKQAIGCGCGYFILTWIAVTSFFGFIFTLAGIITLAGGQLGPTHAGAAAGITVGVGAGIAPEKVPAHTMPAEATTTRMNPRIPSFLTIPSSSFRQTHNI